MLRDAVLGSVQRLDCHVLNRLGNSRIKVRLYSPQGADCPGVAHRHTDTPAGHIVALGERVELHADVFSPLRLHHTDGLVTVECHLRIRAVVTDENVVLLTELQCPVKEIDVGDGAGGIIGVAQPHKLRLRQNVVLDAVKIRQEAVALLERQVVRSSASQLGADGIDRISRVRHQGGISRVDKAKGDMPDALLGANQRQHLGIRVEGHVEAFLIPGGDCPAQFRQSLRFRVAVIGGVLRRLAQSFDDMGGCRYIRVADGEADNLLTLSLLLGYLLVYLDKQVRFQLFYSLGYLHLLHLNQAKFL